MSFAQTQNHKKSAIDVVQELIYEIFVILEIQQKDISCLTGQEICTGITKNNHKKGMNKSGKQHIRECVQQKNKRLKQTTNKFALDQTSDKRRVLFEINDYDAKWNYNQYFWKPKHNRKKTKFGDAHESADQCRVKKSR